VNKEKVFLCLFVHKNEITLESIETGVRKTQMMGVGGRW
jgi:hypothetical protein